MLEQVLEAFLRPAFADGLDHEDGPGFGRLRARLSVESEELYRGILSRAFDASSRAFLEAVMATLPRLPPEEVALRFHFMLGTMIYSMANPGRIQAITKGACDPRDPDEVLAKLVPFLAAGFRAPVRAATAAGARPRAAAPARTGRADDVPGIGDSS